MYCPSFVPDIMNNQQLKQRLPREVFILERCMPLNFSIVQGYPHSFPIEIKYQMPLFHARESESVVKHVLSFYEFTEDFQIHPEDIVMNFFMRSLKDSARGWYGNMPAQCISSWDYFKRLFLS